MRFDCGDTPGARWLKEAKRLENWHPHFALLPRRVGPWDCRWLEWVERKGFYGPLKSKFGTVWGYRWKYRAKP